MDVAGWLKCRRGFCEIRHLPGGHPVRYDITIKRYLEEQSMNQYFPEVKKNFGFGCMRLPMVEGEVDREEMCRMVDAFLAAGFNYFDTAHGYLDGKSEKAL